VEQQVQAMRQYWSANYNVAIKERVDWPLLGQHMGRLPRDCLEKYKEVQRRRHKAQQAAANAGVGADEVEVVEVVEVEGSASSSST